jgi:hypothetical protein
MNAKDGGAGLQAIVRQLAYCQVELEQRKISEAAVLVDVAIRTIEDRLRNDGTNDNSSFPESSKRKI